MEIVVCVKQVPGTSEVEVDPVTGVLKRDGVDSKMNPYDLFALETALRIKKENNATLKTITMGPPQAKKVISESFSMGVDEGAIVSDRKFGGADVLATAYTLAQGIKKIGNPDLIICGKQTTDGDTAQVGPEIAEHLGIPQVTYVQEVKVEGENLIVNRALEDGHQVVEVKTPCLLTAIEELNAPRYMNAGRIFATSDEEIKVWTADDIDVDKSELGLKGSPTKVKKSMTKEVKGAGELVKEPAKEATAYVLSKLKEKHYI